MLAAATRDDAVAAEPVAERSVRPGEVIRLDVAYAAPSDRVVATVLGHEVAFYPDPDHKTWHALVGLDLDTRPGKYAVTIGAIRLGQPALTATHQLRVIPKQFPTRRLRVADRYVNPPASALERIQRESQRLLALFGTLTPRRWDGPFLAPADGYPTSNFGSRSIFNGQPRSPHAGIDFMSPEGTPVRASNAGQVVLAEDLFFTGNTVIVDHGLGLYSLVAHLSTLAVSERETVSRGTVVGLVGATGRVTGPHLHWAVRLNGARVDPLSLMTALDRPAAVESSER